MDLPEEPAAAVDAMIDYLEARQKREHDKNLHGAYDASVQRLLSLRYWLGQRKQSSPVTPSTKPKAAAKVKAAPALPAPPLPLPVGKILSRIVYRPSVSRR